MDATHPTRRERFMERLRRFNRRVTNPIMMTFAGRRIYAVVHHIGQKSGRAYATPVLAMPFNEGFVIPLPYGDHVDWCRNAIAAGRFSLQWSGKTYTVAAPQIVDPATALPAFPPWVQRILNRSHVAKYLKVKVTSDRAPDLESSPPV